MGRRSYSGTAVPTVLSGGIGALDLSFTVQDATGYPDGTAGPFYVTLARGVAGEEKILCDSRSGLTFTVNAAGRGADGTVATSHTASSTTVEHTITKTDLDEANAHVNQTAEADNPHPQYIKTSAANAAYALKTDFSTTAWTTYVPITSGLTIGNGTLSARFKQFGKVVHVLSQFTLGSTSVIGTDPRIQLPVAELNAVPSLGLARFVDASANAHFIGWWREGYVGVNGGPFGQISSTVPFTWAAGDTIFLSITYEAA